MRHFRDLLTLGSAVQYLGWRLLSLPGPLTLRMRSGLSIRMRQPARATDYGVAYEVFVAETYEHPWLPQRASRVIDLGGNVGYSVLHWAARYPTASIVVYEPLPEHVAILSEHVRANRLEHRVTIRPVAVGVSPGVATLHAAGARSAVRGNGDGLRVPVVDFLAEVEGDVDVLKMDIEGSEHLILADPRFVGLRVRLLVMEWHNTPTEPAAGVICAKRLETAGYEIQQGSDHGDGSGMLWARRR